jgi:hypothetical protein
MCREAHSALPAVRPDRSDLVMLQMTASPPEVSERLCASFDAYSVH